MALANLGVTGSVELGAAHDPDLVLGWCRWAEERRQAGQEIRTGLIVRKIQSGERPPQRSTGNRRTAREQKQAEQRALFRERALPFPPGSVCERHADAELRRRRATDFGFDEIFPEDQQEDGFPPPLIAPLCDGELVVVERTGMVITARCDCCRETWSYPLRSLAALPREPLRLGRRLPPEPDPVRPPPLRGGPTGGDGALRRLDPAAALRPLVASGVAA